jgi:hypothetical protein
MPRLTFENGYEATIIGYVFYASDGTQRIKCIVGREDISDTFGLTDSWSEDRHFSLSEAHVAAQQAYHEHGVGPDGVLYVSMFNGHDDAKSQRRSTSRRATRSLLGR